MPTTRREYLERLGDLLPAREAARVVREVEAMILDRLEAEGPEAEPRALEALGPPEVLAERLLERPLVVTLASRRSFVRVFAVLFGTHLLLSVLLAAAGAEASAVPGLLGPIPTDPPLATLLGIATVFFLDAGFLLVLWVALARRGAHPSLRGLGLRPAWSRRDGVLGLVLLGLALVILHPLRDSVFALRRGASLEPFLAPDLVALVPLVDLVLALFALRHGLAIAGWGGRPAALVADAFASAAALLLLVLAATRSELVRLPPGALEGDAARVLGDLMTRTFLAAFVLGALLVVVRLIRHGIQLRRAYFA